MHAIFGRGSGWKFKIVRYKRRTHKVGGRRKHFWDAWPETQCEPWDLSTIDEENDEEDA